MMNKKRLLALLLAVVLVVGMVPNVWATEGETTETTVETTVETTEESTEASSETTEATDPSDATEPTGGLIDKLVDGVKDLLTGDSTEATEESTEASEESIEPTTEATEATIEIIEENEVTTEVTLSARETAVVGQLTPNIQVDLFNYGSAINDNQSTYILGFTSGADNYVEKISGGSAHLYPHLLESADKYPKFDYWFKENINTSVSSNDKTGSLKELFNKDKPHAVMQGGTANGQTWNYGRNDYAFVHLDVDNVRLFQKVGDMFVYNSENNAAYYDLSTKSLTSYNYALRPGSPCSAECTYHGHFLPFNHKSDINSLLVKSNGQLTNTEHLSTYGITAVAASKPADAVACDMTSNDLYALKTKGDGMEKIDMSFGMSVEFDFYMPKNGEVNGEAMIFEFLGDDDVIVYIDGKPVLNIGGGHGATKGNINFKTGVVTVYQMGSNTVPVTDGRCTTLKQIFNLSGDTFEDYTKHTFSFYYLERFGTNANCQLKFNMDPLPVGSLSVQKDVEGIAGNITMGDEYEFVISATPKNTGDTISEISYTKYDIRNTQNKEEAKVDNNGTFVLKDYEKIVFNLSAGTTVNVVEKTDEITSDTAWKLNNSTTEGKSITYTIVEGAAEAAYVCENQRITKALKIKKVLTGDTYEVNDAYQVNVSFNDTPYAGPAKLNNENITIENGIVSVTANDVVVIEGVPTGASYSVTETLPTLAEGSAYKYLEPTYTSGSGTMDDEDVETIITNTLKLLYGNLKIQKTGIESVDHDSDEQQSTVYVIEGKNGTNSEGIYLEVVIVGNHFVTVNHLPVGTYSVREKTDWSWRYTTTKNARDVAVEGNQTTDTAFNNDRTKPYWLSGDSYRRNWWGNLTNSGS